MKGVSIIICCYNSASRIQPTLEHIKEQRVGDSVSWEVVLVDNNSTDSTDAIAKRVWGDELVPLHIIKEPKPGLAHARLTGVLKARFEYIIFCDDDNWLDADYLMKTYHILEARQEVGAVGGQGIPVFEDGTEVPDWFEQEKNYYAVGKQAKESGDVTKERLYLWGAGIGLRRSLFLNCFNGNFPVLSVGRSSTKLSAGDDSEICMRIIILGYTLYYDETLIYKHFISTARLDREYLLKMINGMKESVVLQMLYIDLIQNFIFNKTTTKNIFNKLKEDVLVRKDIRLTAARRLMYWKWGLPVVNNHLQKQLRKFFKQSMGITLQIASERKV